MTKSAVEVSDKQFGNSHDLCCFKAVPQIKKQRYKSTSCAPTCFSWSTWHSAVGWVFPFLRSKFRVATALQHFQFHLRHTIVLLWDGDSFEDSPTETNDSRDGTIWRLPPCFRWPKFQQSRTTHKHHKLPCWRCHLFASCEVQMSRCKSQAFKLQSEKHFVIFELAVVEALLPKYQCHSSGFWKQENTQWHRLEDVTFKVPDCNPEVLLKMFHALTTGPAKKCREVLPEAWLGGKVGLSEQAGYHKWKTVTEKRFSSAGSVFFFSGSWNLVHLNDSFLDPPLEFVRKSRLLDTNWVEESIGK